MKGLLILLALVVSACDHKSVVQVNPTFQAYVDQFQKDASDNGRSIVITNLIIQFGTLDTSTELGQCDNFGSHDTPTITIADNGPHSWSTISEGYREYLIYHELGHCVLGRHHNTKTFSPSAGVLLWSSLMNPEYPGEYWLNYREMYLEELFDPANI